jgi:competence protein ComEC
MRTVLLCLLVVLAGCVGSLPPSAPADTPTPGGPAANGTLELHFINVGQSISTLVIGPTGETMLVDSGDFRDDGEHVISYLQRHDIDRIDYLVTSHADADHIGGHAAVIDYLETEGRGVGAVYDPGIASSTRTYEAYLDAVEAHDVPLYRTQQGDEIPMEAVEVAVLAPPAEYLADEERNENSIVLHLRFGRTSVLLPGDSAEREDEFLVEHYGDDLRTTVLSAGHHGSASSSSEALLDAAHPRVAVISSAYDSQYGHPHEEVLERFAARDITTYWTATHGDVVFRTDGTAVTVLTQFDAPTDPLRLREGAPAEPGATAPLTARETFGGDPVATRTPTTTVATDGGNPLELVAVNYDAPGDDRENPNEETVVFENTGDAPLDLSRWVVRDEADNRYTVPDGVVLEPGARVTLHSGSGTDTASDLYWGTGAVWNNDGDTVIVEDAMGREVLREAYG